MSINMFICILLAILLVAILFCIIIKSAEIKRNNRLLEDNKKSLIDLMDSILFYLPTATEIAQVKQKCNTPETKNIAIEYFNYIIGIYNICGIYCHELHFTKAEIKEHFGNYIAILAEDKTLFNEINRVPGFYKGAEYLLKICR